MQANLQHIINMIIKHHALISWAFHASKEKVAKVKKGNKRKSKVWIYPKIQTMSGGISKETKKRFSRNHSNGFCHAEITDDLKNKHYVFFSTHTANYDKMQYKYINDDFVFSKSTENKLIFSNEKIRTNHWDNLNYIVFIRVVNQEATVYKINWQSIKDYMRERALYTNEDYIEINAADYETFREIDMPVDYEPVCFYKKLGSKAITERHVWNNEKPVILQNIDGSEIRLSSIQQLWEKIEKSEKWKCSSYGYFRRAKSLKRAINSIDGKYKMVWSINPDNIEILTVVLNG